MKIKHILYLFIAVLLSAACKKEPLTEFVYFDSIISETNLNKNDLLIKLKMNPNSAVGQLLPNKILKSVSIRYRTTDPQGNPILASGLITYPTVMPDYQEMGAILAVHFTMGANYEVPSQKQASHESLFALFGYAVIAPDYIGYGETKDKPHPYHHAENTGTVSTDLLFAAKEYFASLNHRFPRNLTIMGYSEGGYASIACLKYIEENYPGWFHLKHVYAGAGAYDLEGSYEEFIKTQYSSQPVTIPILMLGLNYGDNLNMEMKKLFREPLLSQYPEWILSKKYTTDEVSEKIGETDITKFLAPEAFDKTDPNTIIFRESLKRNSVIHWKPETPITLLHGSDDTIVPFMNTEHAYESFSKQGCKVTMHVIKGKDHKPAGNDFYTYCMLKMLTSSKNVEHAALASYLESSPGNGSGELFNY